MRHSGNYRFNLPEYSDTADIELLNANFEIIDEVVKRNENSIRNKVSKEELDNLKLSDLEIDLELGKDYDKDIEDLQKGKSDIGHTHTTKEVKDEFYNKKQDEINKQIIQDIESRLGKQIKSYSGSLDNLIDTGIYGALGGATGKPDGTGFGVVEVVNTTAYFTGNPEHTHKVQKFYELSTPMVYYVRTHRGGVWSGWKKVNINEKADIIYVDNKLTEKADRHINNNLLPNSNFENGLKNWRGNNGALLSIEDECVKCVFNKTSSTPGISRVDNIKLDSGYYTLSADIFNSNPKNRIMFYLFGENNEKLSSENLYPTNEWQRIYSTIHVPKSGKYTLMILTNAAESLTDYMLIRNIKIEKGKTPTLWKSYIDDSSETKIDELQKDVDELFQSGDKANKALVSGLISKGVQASTSDTITTNANKVKDIHIPKYDVGDILTPQQFEVLKAEEGSWDSKVYTDGSTYDYYDGHYASISDSKVSYFNLKTGQGWKINFRRDFSSEYVLQNIITVSDRNIFIVTEKFNNTRESIVIKLDFKGEVVDFNVADVAYGGYNVVNIRSLRNGNGFVTAHYWDDDIRLRFYSNYGLLRKQVIWEDVDYGRYRGYVKTIVPLNNDEYAIVRSIEDSGTGLEDSTVVLFIFDKDGNQKSRQGVSITSAALKDSGLNKPMYVFDLINEDGTQYGDYIYFYNGRGGGGWQSWGGGCFRMKISSANIDTFDNEHAGGGANKVTKLNNGNFVHFGTEKIIERDANTLEAVQVYTKEIHKSYGVVAEDGIYKLANSYYYGRIPYTTGIKLK